MGLLSKLFHREKIVIVRGTGNTLPSFQDNNLKIFIDGNDNIISVTGKPFFLKSQISIEGNSNRIYINNIRYMRYSNIVITGNNQTLQLSDNFSTEGTIFNMCSDFSECIIGSDCMLASNTQIWSGDGHVILDKATGRVLNAEHYKINIGSHVWIAEGTKILKKAKIANNTIVGCNSVVTKPFLSPFCCIAGNPARIVSQNVSWERDSPFEYCFKQ